MLVVLNRVELGEPQGKVNLSNALKEIGEGTIVSGGEIG